MGVPHEANIVSCYMMERKDDKGRLTCRKGIHVIHEAHSDAPRIAA